MPSESNEPPFISRAALVLWHLLIGHDWHDVDLTHIGCRCGAQRGREDWG